MYKLAIIYAALVIGFLITFNYRNAQRVSLHSLSIYLYALSFAHLIHLTLVPYVPLKIYAVTFVTNLALWYLIYNYCTKRKPEVIIIGPKHLVQTLKSHPSINPIATICYDSDQKMIFSLPNLGSIDDLPTILKKYENTPNMALVAERFIAQRLNPFVRCPVIAVDIDNM